jgi:hypothetical protein
MMQTAKIAVTTTGADGSATGTAYSARPLCGELYALYVDWGSTAPAGTSDIVVTVEADDDHPAVTLYSKENAVNDVWVYPIVQNTDTAGSAVASQYQRLPVSGRIKVVVTGCNALAPAVTVYAWVRE